LAYSVVKVLQKSSYYIQVRAQSLKGVWGQVLEALPEELKVGYRHDDDGGGHDEFSEFEGFLKSRPSPDQCLVLVLDDLDSNVPRLKEPFLSQLSGLNQLNVSVIATVRPGVFERVSEIDRKALLSAFGRKLWLSPLSNEEMQSLVKRLLDPEKFTSKQSANIQEKIVELAGGDPLLAQVLAEVLALNPEKPDILKSPDEILKYLGEKDNVKKMYGQVPDAGERLPLLLELWDDLPDSAQDVVQDVVFNRLRKDTVPDTSLQWLIQAGYIRNQDRKVFSPLFERYVQKRFKPETKESSMFISTPRPRRANQIAMTVQQTVEALWGAKLLTVLVWFGITVFVYLTRPVISAKTDFSLRILLGGSLGILAFVVWQVQRKKDWPLLTIPFSLSVLFCAAFLYGILSVRGDILGFLVSGIVSGISTFIVLAWTRPRRSDIGFWLPVQRVGWLWISLMIAYAILALVLFNTNPSLLVWVAASLGAIYGGAALLTLTQSA
jgi:hypothetical protein